MQTETVGQLWTLQSGSTNEPTLNAGRQTSFQFQDVPDRSPTGPLAYYLPGVLLTFRGTITQPGGGGTSIFSDQFFSALFTSLAWVQAWHGSVLQAQNVLGTQWAVAEYFAGGRRYASPVRFEVAGAGAGSYPFEITIFVPFTCNRTWSLEHDTAQLALLARASQLQINAAPTSVLNSLSEGASMDVTVTASAILEPRQDLILGTPIEMILSQIPTGAGNAVKITNFGTDTGLQGIDPGGGVLDLLFLTSLNNQGGSFASEDILDFQWNWRGQNYTQDILGMLSQWKRLLPNPLGGNIAVVTAGEAPLQGIPYSINNNTLYAAGGAGGPANADLKNLLFWALVVSGERPRLSALQTADSDQTFNMTVTGGFSDSHQILGFYARSWQQRMRDQWVAQVMAGGNGSLAAYVLGPNYGSAVLGRRGPQGKVYTTQDEARYLPWQLFPRG